MAAPMDEAIERVLQSFGIPSLKAEQRQILDCLLERKDCFAILPTGYGKSLPHQLLVPLSKELDIDPADQGKVLVCCPIISLMKDQVTKLSQIDNVTAAYKGFSEETDKLIKEGAVDIIYASPETLLGNKDWRSSLQEKLSVSAIVVDECHTIATWGDDFEKKKAFRAWFSCIGELRAMFPEACVLALSATCTNKIKKRVTNEMCLKDCVRIVKSPNKENIKLVFSKVPSDLYSAMFWMIDHLEEMEDFPRLMIYCKSISTVAKLYCYITEEVPSCTDAVEMYHSATPEDTKTTILEKLSNPDSQLKVVIATTSLGMGVDISGFHSVVIYGPPGNVVDLVQEIGRVGRDGKESVALLLASPMQLRGCDKDVKEVFSDSLNCRRITLMSSFLSESELDELKKTTGTHSCCDYCEKKCECGQCFRDKSKLEKMFSNVVEHDERENSSGDEISESNSIATDLDMSDTDDILLTLDV